MGAFRCYWALAPSLKKSSPTPVTLALPGTPLNLTATANSATKVSLTWTAGSSPLPIGSYQVWGGKSAAQLTLLAQTTKASYTDLSVSASTTYYFAVQEKDTGGDLSPVSGSLRVTTPN